MRFHNLPTYLGLHNLQALISLLFVNWNALRDGNFVLDLARRLILSESDSFSCLI